MTIVMMPQMIKDTVDIIKAIINRTLVVQTDKYKWTYM